MKYFFLVVLTLASTMVEAGQQHDLSELNPCLKPLYNRLVNNQVLVGQTHRCDLELKFASEKWLLFHDGYVWLDRTTKYSFLKFKRGMKLPASIANLKKVAVTFEIIATRVGRGSGDMPHLEVQLIEIRPSR